MCGLHAKHPDYVRKSDAIIKKAQRVLSSVEREQKSILCYAPQLSKGIEFLKYLNSCNTSGLSIYLDKSVMNMVAKMESISVPILNTYNKIMNNDIPKEAHIYLTSNNNICASGLYRDIKVDFSLHEDYQGMKKFIKKINPKQAVLVHCGKEYSEFDKTIEQEIMMDGECRTQFIFAEEKEVYKL
jgi:Cft2 family RNA processing exonuclease